MSAQLVVDLGAFADNLARVREVVTPAEMMLVVKDDAYGHGVVEIARRALAQGVRWFGAFDAETGAVVRATVGETARIFIWIAASASEVAAAVAARLDIGVGDPGLLEDVAIAASAASVVARVHLKIDTGLHRNGVRPEMWPEFTARAREWESAGVLEVVGVWSHIAEASDDEDDVARAGFEDALAVARNAGLTPSLRHLAASAASFARPEFRYDLVRVGAFAYGISPAGGPSAGELGIRPIATLRTTVSGLESDGVRVGIGALDGLPSTLAGRIEVGTPAGPRRLRVVDRYESIVDGWPGAGIGQEVVVFGADDDAPRSVTEAGEAIGTIGEEIAVRISPGVTRRYSAT